MSTKPLRRAQAKLLAFLHRRKRHPKPASSPAPPKEKAPTTPSPLDSLPQELKLQILKLVDLQSLRNLTLASPAYNHSFHSSKHQILRGALERDVHPSLRAEAKRVWRARHRLDEGRVESVVRILIERERKTSLESAETEELMELARWHLLIQDLTAAFCSEALRPVSGNGMKGDEGKGEWDGEISEMERFRIYRAMYGFELFGACFTGKGIKPRGSSVDARAQEMADMFFVHTSGWEWYTTRMRMRPWEVEELACVRDWMVRIYGGVLQETRGMVLELDVERERGQLRCFMRKSVALEERARKQVAERSEVWEHDQCETLLMLGLPFLAKIMKAGSSEEKFELWKEHLIPSSLGTPAFLTKALKTQPQGGHGHGHRNRRRIEFEGDAENGPNAAWVYSKKKYVREYRHRWFLDDAKCWREWGYCLWDEERLKGWGFRERKWRNGRRKRTGRWICTPQVRSSGRVVPKWVWVLDGMG